MSVPGKCSGVLNQKPTDVAKHNSFWIGKRDAKRQGIEWPLPSHPEGRTEGHAPPSSFGRTTLAHLFANSEEMLVRDSETLSSALGHPQWNRPSRHPTGRFSRISPP